MRKPNPNDSTHFVLWFVCENGFVLLLSCFLRQVVDGAFDMKHLAFNYFVTFYYGLSTLISNHSDIWN